MRRCLAGWCNGSTTDSGSVSEGSNPSPAAPRTSCKRQEKQEGLARTLGLLTANYHLQCSSPTFDAKSPSPLSLLSGIVPCTLSNRGSPKAEALKVVLQGGESPTVVSLPKDLVKKEEVWSR